MKTVQGEMRRGAAAFWWGIIGGAGLACASLGMDEAGPNGSAGADLDGDGMGDLVARRGADVFVGRGPGFTNWVELTNLTLVFGQRAAAAGDVDGDGATDLLIYERSRLSVARGPLFQRMDPLTPPTQRPLKLMIGTLSADAAAPLAHTAAGLISWGSSNGLGEPVTLPVPVTISRRMIGTVGGRAVVRRGKRVFSVEPTATALGTGGVYEATLARGRPGALIAGMAGGSPRVIVQKGRKVFDGSAGLLGKMPRLYTIVGPTDVPQWSGWGGTNATSAGASTGGGITGGANSTGSGSGTTGGTQTSGGASGSTGTGMGSTGSSGTGSGSGTGGVPGTTGGATGASTGATSGGSTGSPPVVNRVRFYPRAGMAGRMAGGRFTGSNSGETTAFVELMRITGTPAEGAFTEIEFANGTAFRWIKFESPQGGHGNIAELEFYSGSTRLEGRAFGTSGSFNNQGNTYHKALDGNTTTFFDAPLADGVYVGIALDAFAVAEPMFSPGAGPYANPVEVTLTSATSGAEIRYTTDGIQPGPGRGQLYAGPIALSASTTIKAQAFAEGRFASAVVEASYRIGSDPVGEGQTTYHLGNSLTDTINGWLDPIADSAGFNHTFMRSTIPGAPTDWIWDHDGQALGEASYTVVFDTRGPIDHLFTQPFAGHNRSIENEADYSGRFFALCREKSPDVRHWLYVQWPPENFMDDAWSRGEGAASGLGLAPATTWQGGVTNHMAYTEAVRQRMDDAQGGKGVLIVPGGLALAALKTEIEAGRVPGMSQFFETHFSDDLHLNGAGSYLIGLVHFACVYRVSPEGRVTAQGSTLTSEQAALYQRIAWDTARKYRWSGIAP